MRLRDDSGNILMLTALGLTVLCGVLALAVDAGRILYNQRQLQSLADAAAMAGAIEISTCGSTSNCTAMQNAAKSALTENGVTNITMETQCGSSSGTGLVLTVNNGPCALGSKDPNYKSTSYVEAVVSMPVNTIFASVLGVKSMTVAARAEAGGSSPSYCIYVLDTSGQTVNFNSNAKIISPKCGIMVDSNGSSAVMVNTGANIDTDYLGIVGGYTNNNGTISVTPTTGAAAVADPLASLPTPPIGSCGTTTSSPYYGSPGNIAASGAVTLNQGVYCGDVNFNSGTYTVTMNPGTYIFKGALNLNTGVTIQGTGVTLYFTSRALNLNSGSTAKLTAPTSGTYTGILYFQSRTDSTTIILNSGTTSILQGAIYASDAQLNMNSASSATAYMEIVVGELLQNTGSVLTIGTDYSSLSGGSPIKGSGSNFVE